MKNPSLEIDSAGGDYSLMEMLAQHQPEALRMLYDRYHGILRSIITKIVRDEADSDDVLQDVFSNCGPSRRPTVRKRASLSDG